MDDTDEDVGPSDRFSVVLEAMDYDVGGYNLDGVYRAAGSGGKVVTGTLEFISDEGIFTAEYVPFVAGTHRLNVTFQVRKRAEVPQDMFRTSDGLLAGISRVGSTTRGLPLNEHPR